MNIQKTRSNVIFYLNNEKNLLLVLTQKSNLIIVTSEKSFYCLLVIYLQKITISKF